MQFLRQNTSKKIVTPPLVDDSDFKTLETSIAFDAAGIGVQAIKADMSVQAITPAENAGDWYWAHVSNASYQLTLKTTDVDTLGPLRIQGQATGVLPWWRDFYVLSAQVYDSLFRMTETLDLLNTNAQTLDDASPNNLAAGAEMGLTSGAISSVQSGLATDGGEMDLVDAPNSTAIDAFMTALLAKAVDGATTMEVALQKILSGVAGKWGKSGNVYTLYQQDGTTALLTLTISDNERTPASP